MTSRKVDWMKRNHYEFHHQVNMTYNRLNDPASDKLVDWGYLPTSSLYLWIRDEFITEVSSFNIVFENWSDSSERNKIKQTALVSAEKSLRAKYRELYKMIKSNVLVTNEDLLNMGFPVRGDNKKTHTSKVDDIITANVKFLSPGTIEINYREQNSNSYAKPARVHGAEIYWGVLDKRVELLDELPNRDISTATPFILSLPFTDRGRHFNFAMRWEYNNGKKGYWSNVFHTIII